MCKVTNHIGYGPIEAQHAEAFQKFYTPHFNPLERMQKAKLRLLSQCRVRK